MSETVVFVPDMAIAASPKKKNKPPKKKQKNDTLKNQQKPGFKQTQEVELEKAFHKRDTDNVSSSKNAGSSKAATTERTNMGQRPQYQQKKKNNGTPKKTNTAQLQNRSPAQKAVLQQEDRHVKANEYTPQEKISREEKKYQMELQRRQMEEERRKKWYHYFLTKPHDLLTLDRNQVVVLKSVEKSRPQAQFVCRVCNYYCDNMAVVTTHIRKPAHQRLLQDYSDDVTLRELPDLTMDQLAILNTYLAKVVTDRGMDPEDLETRRTIAVLVGELVATNLPGCSIRLFGSSIHGLGLKSADVNIDLQVPKDALPPAMLKGVAALLRESAHFINVVENFDCEFPYVSFHYKKSGELCSVSLNNERAVSLAILLSKYTPLDPRLAQLATLFRSWGQMTDTDRPHEGTWPGYAFYLMTIFYLQQCPSPVLPVLNDLLTEKGESESANTTKVLSMNVSDIKEKWRTSNKENLASLWIGLLKFYTIDFNYMEYIVSIDSSALIPRRTRKIFIVDPFLPTRNVARSVTCNSMFYYILGCLITTCRYFSIPQIKNGPLFGDIYVRATNYHPDHEALLYAHDSINSQLVQLLLKLDQNFHQSKAGVTERNVNELMQLIQANEFHNIDDMPVSSLERGICPPRQYYRIMCVSPSDAKLIVSSVNPKCLEYNFNIVNCTGGEKAPRICSVCRREGHLKDNCPEERLPPLEPLPERTPEAMSVLDHLCQHIFDKWRQSDEDIMMREKICKELQEFITTFHPCATLELFGSTKNGFGLKGSDMDICLTFSNNKTGEGLDARAFIDVLYRLLKTFKGVQDLLPIATAKVPIVKFTHRATKLDGDISLYNVLAMENSKLLCTYAKIDERARILGYMMKRFSKVCRIGDASKGSLSSYAYTLLVIYFLQQCQPPVLPVLQELTESGCPPPKHIVEGCNAYFFQDLSKLDQVWPGRGQNTQSAGELWLNLLIFYTELFDMVNNVICIRCSHTVTKFEKLWISKGFAIEDPFDLSHNLGSALTRKMSLYIIKALRKGRNHFGRPMNPKMPARDIEAYYLNVKDLTDGEPPNDRGCRICKSIGHKEKDCPEKKKKGWNRPNKKKESSPKKETPARKPPIKNQDDDDDDDDGEEYDVDSNSDKESSEQEDSWSRNPEKEDIKKSERVPMHKTVMSSEVNGHINTSDQLPRRSPAEMSPVPPGFMAQDTSQTPNQQFPQFYSPHKTPPKNNTPQNCLATNNANTPNSIKLTPNSANASKSMRLPSKNANISKPIKFASNSAHTSKSLKPQSPDTPFVSQGPMSNNKQVHIPTIVFNNSKLSTEPTHNSINPIRYHFPPGQELVRPPPGFIPMPQNNQRFPNPVPFHHEQKPVGQNSWNFEGYPFLPTTAMTSPKMEYMCGVPLYASPPPPISPGVTSPRPPVGPAFNNLRFTGMLGPTEQLIWGQSSPPPSQPPTFRPNTSERAYSDSGLVHSLDASISKIHITSSTTNMSSLVDLAQQELQTTPDFPKMEGEIAQNTANHSFSVSSNNVVNST